MFEAIASNAEEADAIYEQFKAKVQVEQSFDRDGGGGLW